MVKDETKIAVDAERNGGLHRYQPCIETRLNNQWHQREIEQTYRNKERAESYKTVIKCWPRGGKHE
jgi:hypothetical protein